MRGADFALVLSAYFDRTRLAQQERQSALVWQSHGLPIYRDHRVLFEVIRVDGEESRAWKGHLANPNPGERLLSTSSKGESH